MKWSMETTSVTLKSSMQIWTENKSLLDDADETAIFVNQKMPES